MATNTVIPENYVEVEKPPRPEAFVAAFREICPRPIKLDSIDDINQIADNLGATSQDIEAAKRQASTRLASLKPNLRLNHHDAIVILSSLPSLRTKYKITEQHHDWRAHHFCLAQRRHTYSKASPGPGGAQ